MLWGPAGSGGRGVAGCLFSLVWCITTQTVLPYLLPCLQPVGGHLTSPHGWFLLGMFLCALGMLFVQSLTRPSLWLLQSPQNLQFHTLQHGQCGLDG